MKKNSRYSTPNFSVTSIATKEEPRSAKPVYFTTEVENEVIRGAFSNELIRYLFKPQNKVWKYSTKFKTPDTYFQIEGSLHSTN